MSVPSHHRSWFSRLLDRIDDRLSARADAAARMRSHSVTRVAGSRTKVYRNDALWDLVRELNDLTELDEAELEETEVDKAGEEVPTGEVAS